MTELRSPRRTRRVSGQPASGRDERRDRSAALIDRRVVVGVPAVAVGPGDGPAAQLGLRLDPPVFGLDLDAIPVRQAQKLEIAGREVRGS